ncbi:hypothetical protein TI39_contig426g00011 [Zymoseptoria brevis]|uniref:RING-type domain-containing protein n=1 Tax=Zymoseptoria brevis TaxID=1047168 RepID=A0A0F4GLF9_9PEZI|nr:hypothetical protein TI39_contig426g00011 [Zymoseptoria brevis]
MSFSPPNATEADTTDEDENVDINNAADGQSAEVPTVSWALVHDTIDLLRTIHRPMPVPNSEYRHHFVGMPTSLLESVADGLTVEQCESFWHWYQHMERMWAHNAGGIQDEEGAYNPFEDKQTIISWWVFTNTARREIEKQQAKPLYKLETTVDQLNDNMPKQLVSVEVPQEQLGDDEAINAAVIRRHKRVADAMIGDCDVCYEALATKTGYLMRCGHVACVGCMLRWLKGSRNCPSCRREVHHDESVLVQLVTADEAREKETFLREEASKNAAGGEPDKKDSDE